MMDYKCSNGSEHQLEKVILVKRYSFGDFGFIWWRCKVCKQMKPTSYSCDMDMNGYPLTSRLKNVRDNHPYYELVEEK